MRRNLRYFQYNKTIRMKYISYFMRDEFFVKYISPELMLTFWYGIDLIVGTTNHNIRVLVLLF